MESEENSLPSIENLLSQIAQLEKANPNSSGFVILYSLLGQAYLQKIDRKKSENLNLDINKMIAAFDRAIKFQPQSPENWYSIKTLKRAIELNPEFKEMAKDDSDFDNLRGNIRFQELLFQ